MMSPRRSRWGSSAGHVGVAGFPRTYGIHKLVRTGTDLGLNEGRVGPRCSCPDPPVPAGEMTKAKACCQQEAKRDPYRLSIAFFSPFFYFSCQGQMWFATRE